MAKTLVRGVFMYDGDAVSEATGLACRDVSLTSQEDKEDADINVLVRRFGVTGEIPVLDRLPLIEDFVGLTDYHSAMNALVEADRTFMELPAELRARFDHNAGKFVDFCSDEKNRDELVKLGLVESGAKAPDPAAKPPAAKPGGEAGAG